MCGIVGVAGNINKIQENIFRNLLVIDAIRGEDSTGVISVPQDTSEGVLYEKEVGHPYNLLEKEGAKKTLDRPNSVLIGHNRFATTGRVNSDNAHPFHFDNIIGVHNGTLYSQHRLPDHKEFEVDSANIFYAMALNGVKETIELLSGAYALAWFNTDEWTFNFIRNKERPLFYYISDDDTKLYWASEAYMLHLVLARNKVVKPSIRSFAEDSHYKFHLPKKKGDELIGPERTRIEGYKQPPFYQRDPWPFEPRVHTRANRGRIGHNRSSVQKPPLSLIKGGKTEETPLTEAEEAEYAALLSEPNYLSVPEVDKRERSLDVSCSVCDDTILFGERRQWLFNEPCCMDCFTNPDVRECYSLDVLTKEEMEELGIEKKEFCTKEEMEEYKKLAKLLRRMNKKSRKKRLAKYKKQYSPVAYSIIVKLLNTKGVLK